MGYVPAAVTIVRKAALALALGALVVAGACAPNGGGGLSAGHMSASLPGKLSKLTLDQSNLAVHVIAIDASTKDVVEDKDLINLVAPGDGTYAGDLPDALPVGDYLFTVIFFHKDGSTRTELARTGDIAGTVKEDTTTPIDTSAETLAYANDDGDQLDNIDEIDAGTDTKTFTPVVALFADTTYVQYDPADSAAEASNIEAIFKAAKVFVRTFTGVTAADFRAALKGADGLVIPDLNGNDLGPDLDAAATTVITGFAGRGGTVFMFAPASTNLTLANALFGLGLAAAGGSSSDLSAFAAAGTPLAAGPATLANNDATALIGAGTLANPAQAIYTDGAGDAAVANVPVGHGRVLIYGWDFNDALPIGSQDGGWLDALLLAADYTIAHPKVALFTNTDYVDYDPTFADTGAEASNTESTLSDVGIGVTQFTDISADGLTKALAGMDVAVIPDLENKDLAPDLDAAAVTVLNEYVSSAGGTLVFMGGSDINEINTVFGLSLVGGSGAAKNLDPVKAEATPFARGPASVPSNNATSGVTVASLPVGSRALYSDGTAATVVVIPVGTGHVVYLGWDWFFSASDVKDAWFQVLDAAMRYAPGQVALYADPAFVDYFVQINGGAPNASEATNLEEGLNRILGVKPTTFDGVTAADFTLGIGTRNVLIIPELELGDLAAGTDAAAKTVISDFVTAGGTAVLHFPSTNQINMLNQTFGLAVAALSPDADPTLQAAAVGTLFEGGPGSLPRPSGTTGLDPATLPAGSVALYASPNGSSVVTDIPVGTGHVIVMGWDWFSAVPLGTVDSGWIEVLKRGIAAGLS